MGIQAGVVNHAFHLNYKCCMWAEFQSISTWLRRFSPGTPVSSLLKIDSQSNPTGCGAVLRGHTWVVFRGRALSRQHSSFRSDLVELRPSQFSLRLRGRAIRRSDIINKRIVTFHCILHQGNKSCKKAFHSHARRGRSWYIGTTQGEGRGNSIYTRFLIVFTSSENDGPTGFVKTKSGGGEGCESQLSSALKGRIVGKIGKRGKTFVAILI